MHWYCLLPHSPSPPPAWSIHFFVFALAAVGAANKLISILARFAARCSYDDEDDGLAVKMKMALGLGLGWKLHLSSVSVFSLNALTVSQSVASEIDYDNDSGVKSYGTLGEAKRFGKTYGFSLEDLRRSPVALRINSGISMPHAHLT